VVKKIALWAVLALLWVGSVGGGGYWSYNKGMFDGMNAYHYACYNVGGLVVDENTGTVVQCMPLRLSPEEKKNFTVPLDKGTNT
jgi:hypothetical protein